MKTTRPRSGDIIPPGYFGDLHDDIRACELSGGPGIRVTRTPNGTIVSAIPRPSGPSGGSSGEVALGVLVSGPSGGYGPAVWRAITVNPDGTWTATGEEVPVIVPLLK
ncbi:hypothetical protein [Victivallis lenta]|uniref:hypothetical protein n=1 Tax=Victivallis lenta TaxID=2606640 RepID=UPI0023550B24|nr:hypothetical protein [Victivallis lenta]